MDNKVTYVKENLEPLFEKFKDMLRVETVVGEPVQLGETTIVPFVDISVGVGAGRVGGGGGAKVEPTAVLVIKGERIELFNIKGSAKYTGFDRLIGMVPEIISKLKKDNYVYINDEETAK